MPVASRNAPRTGDCELETEDSRFRWAVEAIAAAGRIGTIRVIGFDAVDDARRAIAAGTMDASVAQFPSEMGRLAIESAVRLLRGEPVPPEQPTKVGLVTRANLDPAQVKGSR